MSNNPHNQEPIEGTYVVASETAQSEHTQSEQTHQHYAGATGAAASSSTVGGTDMKTYTMIAYILVLASILTGGITLIASLIMAIIKRDEMAGTFYYDHLNYIYKTSLYSILASVILVVSGAVLSIIIIGPLLGALGLLLVSIWVLVRGISGLVKLNDQKSVPDGWGI